MDITLQSVNLLCSDVHKQSSFVSFLFDVEILFDKEERYFLLGGQRFNLVQGRSSVQNQMPSFELMAESETDLKFFKQKFELYLYKSGSEQMKTSFNPGSFEFEDPSGNLWRINSPGKISSTVRHDGPLM